MLGLILRALIEALVRQIPTFVEMIAKARARAGAGKEQQAKDTRNEKAIEDALKAKAEKPTPP